MKKTVLLLMAAFLMTAFNTKAKAEKKQFVFWTSGVPNATEAQIIRHTLNAFKGVAITGADIRATPDNYKQVYGERGYQMLLGSPISDFSVGYSSGNEKNWGIENAVSVVTGTLNSGVKVVMYKGVPIAKWGTNGCINALSVPIPDPVDPDNNKPGSNPPLGAGNQGLAAGSNNNNNVINNQSISWEAGYGIYSQGRNDRTTDFSQDALMFMAIQKSTPAASNSACCGQQQTQTVAYSPQPVLYSQASYAAPAPAAQNANQTITLRNKANGWDIANTLANVGSFGLALYNTITPERVRVVGSNYGYSNTWSNNPTILSGGFQGSGALGFSPTILGTGTTVGSWGNTW